MEATGLCVCWENISQDTAHGSHWPLCILGKHKSGHCTEENRMVKVKDNLISVTISGLWEYPCVMSSLAWERPHVMPVDPH